jgi:hypothetical protein
VIIIIITGIKNPINSDVIMPNSNQMDEYFIVDSIFSFNQLNNTHQKILLKTDSNEIVQPFFSRIIQFETVIYLKIQIDSLQLFSIRDSIIELLKAKKLKELIINAISISDVDYFINHISFYSTLETLQISAQKYSKIKFDNNDDFDLMTEPTVISLCKSIIENNQKTKNFLENILPNIFQEIDLLKLNNLEMSNTQGLSKLSKPQIKYLISLGKRYDEFTKFTKHDDSLSQDLSYKGLLRLSVQWEIKTIVTNNDSNRFKLLLKYDKALNLNKRYPYLHNPKLFPRLIDIAVNHKYSEMVELLTQNGAELTCAHSSDNPFRGIKSYSNVYRDISNFPFAIAISNESRHQQLRDFFLNNETALYDGLAWFIYSNEIIEFEKIMQSVTVDVNKKISSGTFQKFTLLQLILCFRRTGLLIKLLQNKTSKEYIQLANQIYPENKLFLYSNWSLLAFIIHQGLYDELQLLLQKGSRADQYVVKRNLACDAISLLFYGACEVAKKVVHIQKDNKQRKLQSFKNCLNYLTNFFEFNLQKYKFYMGNDKNLPLLHFSLAHNIYTLIADKIEYFSEDNLLEHALVETESCDEPLNPLQLSVLLDSDFAKELCDHYYRKGLINSILLPLKTHYNINLFQYCIISRKGELLDKFIQWNNFPINQPFPLSHPEYPGWLPIHVAILSDFYGSNISGSLLRSKGINIIMPFPAGGNFSHHLVGISPLSAIFYNGGPRKNYTIIHRILTNYAKTILKLIDESNLSTEDKNDVRTEALCHAVINHDIENNHDHSEYITQLIDAGANAFHNLNNGMRIINIAYDKGLIALFQNTLQGSFKPVSGLSSIKLIKNKRHSELCLVANTSYQIEENNHVVVSLVRNDTSKVLDHVFIVIERILYGLSEMHFIDFVKSERDLGQIRHDIIQGGIKEDIIFKERKILKINALEDLIVQQWQISVEACDAILASIQEDQSKNIKYAMPGNYGLFSSSMGKGHNCYSWAREKLQASNDPYVQNQLRPTKFDDWLAIVPRWKLVRQSKKRPNGLNYPLGLFTKKQAILSATIISGISGSIFYAAYNSFSNQP